MNGAFLSGSTFGLERRYIAVTMQQGRVELDDDWSDGARHADVTSTESRVPDEPTFDAGKRYTGVTLQQGATQFDADSQSRSMLVAEACPPWVPAALRW
jgi:hypothetical protein